MAEETPETEQPASPEDAAASPDTPAGDAAEDAIDKAQEAAEAIANEAIGSEPNAESIDLPDFDAPSDEAEDASSSLGLLHDVDLNVKIELGRTRMYVEDVLKLNENSVIELDKAAGDPVDVYVNGRHVARGEVLVLNENFCVRISEIVQPADAGN